MAKNVTQYDLLISCPGDVKEEVQLIRDAVEQFNQLYSDMLEISIRVRRWDKSSYSQSGGKPQTLLNHQFINDCDAAVAIFWTRFGTPTDEYGSGTEEEIELMLQSDKQVFMYFCDKPIAPALMDAEGFKKVQAFRERYQDRGLYSQYSSNEEFSKMFFAHLSQHFLSKKSVEAVRAENGTDIIICGIDENGDPCQNGLILPFVPNSDEFCKEYEEKVRTLYGEINDTHLQPPLQLTGILAGYNNLLGSPVHISDDDKSVIKEMAKLLTIRMEDDFFDLGALSYEVGFIEPFGSRPLNGNSEEKKKYRQIRELHKVISNWMYWAPFENEFSEMLCTKLAVQNNGSRFDEDVEITLTFSKGTFIAPTDFPKLPYASKQYLCTKCGIDNLFAILPSATIDDYQSSHQVPSGINMPNSINHNPINPDYDDVYADDLNDTFCYSVYTQGNKVIVKLKLDYIKHNTTIAFPTPIFFADRLNSIPYRITSKHNANIKEGTISLT